MGLIAQRGLSTGKVWTFATEIKIFHSVRELKNLDEAVNMFLSESDVKKVVAVSDACDTDKSGAAIDLIRTVAYEC